MKSRWFAVLALVAAVGLVVPACGGDDSESSDVKSSDTRNETTTEAGGSGDSGDTSSGDSDTTMPDMSDLGDLGDCMQIAGVYAGLALSAMGSPEDAQKARDQAEELKSELPEELHDDLDTVADAFATVAEKGMIEGADALDTPEFNQANKNIEDYLTKECGS